MKRKQSAGRSVLRTKALFLTAALLLSIVPLTVLAKTALKERDTGIGLGITASGIYSWNYRNWDGVSNVDSFVYKGNYCFAYESGNNVYVVKTKNGAVSGKTITLKKQYPLFGGITADAKGNFYLVCGKENTDNSPTKKSIFVSKYSKTGKHIKTVGDNGSSSLADYYSEHFRTKTPFRYGNCDVAINGNLLAVNYAREMLSGHQSNSVFLVDIDKMKPVYPGKIYQSHSFAQRAIPYGDGFVFAGEGDCYDRAFTIFSLTNGNLTKSNSFHFWVKPDTLNNWDMSSLNNNFAHMGGLASVDGTNVALVGTSVKSLSEKAEKETEQLFIQIFDPTKDLSQASSFVTRGKRKGLGGPNGDEKVVDYGVKWLTSYGADTKIRNPQVVSDGKGTILILFERYDSDVFDVYKGVYSIKLDQNGKVKQKAALLSGDAHLNPCRMPVYAGGRVYWTGNRQGDAGEKLYVYSLKL